MCNSTASECKYVYAFDFKHHPEEEGDEKFMEGGTYGNLKKYNKILSISPIYHQKLYCGYKDRQRVDFLLLHHNGTELFEFLYQQKQNASRYKSGSTSNLWLSFVFLMTCLYSFGILHHHGYVHRDLKPENMLIGNIKNKDRNYMMVADYGFVTKENNGKRYDVTGTPEYLTPKLSKIYQKMERSSTLTFIDLVEHDLHTIGYNLVQMLLLKLYNSSQDKNSCNLIQKSCGKRSVDFKNRKTDNNYCNIDPMVYIACHNNIDGTLGNYNDISKLSEKHKQHNIVLSFPEPLLNVLKKCAIRLSDFGFDKHFKNSNEAKEYAIDMFYEIAFLL